ncbi:hypothetical protein CBL_12910 [Carabus blaptoides fortunei]
MASVFKPQLREFLENDRGIKTKLTLFVSPALLMAVWFSLPGEYRFEVVPVPPTGWSVRLIPLVDAKSLAYLHFVSIFSRNVYECKWLGTYRACTRVEWLGTAWVILVCEIPSFGRNFKTFKQRFSLNCGESEKRKIDAEKFVSKRVDFLKKRQNSPFEMLMLIFQGPRSF